MDPSPKIPGHVAIVMDGNGRWATSRGLSRTEGHRKGAEMARQIVETAKDLGIAYLTLFAFSSENWNRPADEVSELMNLLRYYLKKETAELHKSGARILIIGDRERLPKDIVKLIENAETLTHANQKITVVLALSYGGRQDILYAAKELARQAKTGEIDLDGLTVVDLAVEDLHAQWIQDLVLDDPLEGPGTVGGIIPLRCEVGPGLVTEFHRELLPFKPLLKFGKLDVHDLTDLLVGEAVENHDFVDAVEKLGAEVSPE